MMFGEQKMLNIYKLLAVLTIFLLSCEYEDCEDGTKQKIGDVCYECVEGKEVIIDCEVI